MRPPAMVGCTAAEASPENANAHFSFSFGTSDEPNPAARWKRSFASETPQPFHDAGCAAVRPGASQVLSGGGAGVSPIALPLRNAAIARRSSGVRAAPCVRIDPVSSAPTMRSGAMTAKARRGGVRGVPPSWQRPQYCEYSAAPSGAGVWAHADPAINTNASTHDARRIEASVTREREIGGDYMTRRSDEASAASAPAPGVAPWPLRCLKRVIAWPMNADER